MRRIFCVFTAVLMALGMAAGCATVKKPAAAAEDDNGHQVKIATSLKRLSENSAELKLSTRVFFGNSNGWLTTQYHAPLLICNVGDEKSYIVVPDEKEHSKWIPGALSLDQDGVAVHIKAGKNKDGLTVDCIVEFRSKGDRLDSSMHTVLVAPSADQPVCPLPAR